MVFISIAIYYPEIDISLYGTILLDYNCQDFTYNILHFYYTYSRKL